MTTFLEAKQQITAKLKSLGISSSEARRETELILEYATECNTAQQVLRCAENLSASQNDIIQHILAKREERVPLQYCIGHTWFMGSRFEVQPGIFIPRSDTETLVAYASELIAASDIAKSIRSGASNQADASAQSVASARTSALRIVEVGIGSGAIAISLLKMHHWAEILAIDASPTACSISRRNAELNGVSERLEIRQGDWKNLLPDDIDVLMSNPPYIPLGDGDELLPEVAWHEPKEALFGTGADGLGFYRDFAAILPGHFRHGKGLIAVEVGDGQSGSVSQIFAAEGWVDIAVLVDMSATPRVVTARKS